MSEITNELVFKAQAGDEDANRAIVEGLHRPVIATIFRFLGAKYRRDVEDLAQEVFLKVFRSIDKFDPSRAKFTTWVYTFVRNHCFDVLKKRRIKTTTMHAVGGEESDHDFPDQRELQPTQSADNAELGRRIGEALETLVEDQRMAFVLR